MFRNKQNLRLDGRSRGGFVLVIAIVVLVVLATVTTTLSIRIARLKRRQQYMVEYQRGRYAIDSAIKYILDDMPRRNYSLKVRDGAPDFSDIFYLDQEAYGDYILSWAELAEEGTLEKYIKEDADVGMEDSAFDPNSLFSSFASLFGGGDEDEGEPEIGHEDAELIEIDPNDIEVPGPYGQPWPLVAEPIEFEIGPSKIEIRIEDENAKMPLAWAVTNKKTVNEQAEAVLESFCVWMSMDKAEQMLLKEQLADVLENKMFEINPQPILLRTTTSSSSKSSSSSSRFKSSRTSSRYTRTSSSSKTSSSNTRTTTTERPEVAHAADFAKLFHSSLVDTEMLARPLNHTGQRVESPLKYLALWGSQRVNINTAPRHVLEAAFMFGGSQVELAEAVIQRRQIKPFTSTKELRDEFYQYSMEIDRVKDYITVTSNFFSIHISCVSGNARVSAVVTVIKEGKKLETLAVLYGR